MVYRPVIATAQATICRNLMQYIVRNCGEDQETWSAEVRELRQWLTDGWEVLLEKPLAFVAADHLVPPDASKKS